METVVVGAGPAGLMAAAEAAAGGNVTLVERNEKPGKKLYITGKGRCNVTNAVPPSVFLERVVRNPKFAYGALFSFTPADTVRLLEENGTPTRVERGNRVFPLSDKASDVTAALVRNAERRGVTFLRGDVRSITREDEGFTADISGEKRRFDRVILACGGVSYPSTGSNGDGFKLAAALGHTITPLRPALVPMELCEDVSPLEGLSLKNVRLTIAGGKKEVSEFGEMLFTASGVSGPIVLSASSRINREPDLSRLRLLIDLKPALDEKTLDRRILGDFSQEKNKYFKNSLNFLLPKSLIPYIIKRTGISPDKPVNSITREERAALVATLKGLSFRIKALGPAAEGIVTSGGVDVSEVNPKTMESRLVKGLYFAGEMLDIDALTGGFNIQLALSTGHAAGAAAGKGETNG